MGNLNFIIKIVNSLRIPLFSLLFYVMMISSEFINDLELTLKIEQQQQQQQ